jgi:hypothetical protein
MDHKSDMGVIIASTKSTGSNHNLVGTLDPSMIDCFFLLRGLPSATLVKVTLQDLGQYLPLVQIGYKDQGSVSGFQAGILYDISNPDSNVLHR